ncbi:MAG: septum formation initiator family protein [Firmicutes bacterium]|nr:septum formation initiator family protein [Bacillota bacterium]
MAEKVISLAARRKQSKQPRRRWRATPKVFVFILCIICIRIGGGFAVRYFNIIRLQSKVTRIQREIVAFEQRNDAIREEIEHMQSDEYIERVAREKLGLVKPGEVIYKPVRPAGHDDPLDVPKRSGTNDVLAGGGY